MKKNTFKSENNILSVFAILFLLLNICIVNAQVGIGTTSPNSTFEVNGSMSQSVTTVTSNATLDETESVIICNNGSTPITITLPTAVGIDGRIYTIKRDDSSTKNVTIATTSSQMIDGMPTLLLTNAKEAVTLISNGADWKKLSSNDSNNVQFPMGEINYFDPGTGTTVTISSVSNGSTNLVKCGPVTTLSAGATEFDNGGSNNGRLRYTGSITKCFHVACTISVVAASSNTDQFIFGIAKNGVVIPSSKVIQKLGNGNDTQSTALHVVATLATNDYLELYMGDYTSAADAKVKSLTLFALGMYMNGM